MSNDVLCMTNCGSLARGTQECSPLGFMGAPSCPQDAVSTAPECSRIIKGYFPGGPHRLNTSGRLRLGVVATCGRPEPWPVPSWQSGWRSCSPPRPPRLRAPFPVRRRRARSDLQGRTRTRKAQQPGTQGPGLAQRRKSRAGYTAQVTYPSGPKWLLGRLRSQRLHCVP